MPLLRYEAVSSGFFDLGIFTTNFWNTAREPTRALVGHVQPFSFPLGLAYSALSAETATYALIGFQTAALLGSVAAVWRVFGTPSGLAMLLYSPLWANSLFDFHLDHLTVPLLTVYFIACDRRGYVVAGVAAICLALVKEPFALMSAAAGLHFAYLAFSRRRESNSGLSAALAPVMLVFGLSWFFVATQWLMPYFGDAGRGVLDSTAFSWLGSGMGEIALTVLTRPDLIILDIVSTQQKLLYVLVLFAPFLFIPLLRPAPLIIAAPILAISLLSRDPNYYSHAVHYSAGIIVPAVIAFGEALPVAKRLAARIIGWIGPLRALGAPQTVAATTVGICLGASILFWHWAYAPSPLGRLFWSDKVWANNWRAYVPTARDWIIKTAIDEYVPTDPAITVSSQNTLNWGNLPRRYFYLPFPFGVIEPHLVPNLEAKSLEGLLRYIQTGESDAAPMVEVEADFVIIDTRQPYFVGDKGCGWISGACTLEAVESDFLDTVETTYATFELVFEHDGFAILRRPAT